MKIFKYKASLFDSFILEMPEGAKILSVQTQNNIPFIWALVNPSAPLRKRTFRLAGTGHEIRETLKQLDFIDTFQMADGRLVFHVFEVV